MMPYIHLVLSGSLIFIMLVFILVAFMLMHKQRMKRNLLELNSIREKHNMGRMRFRLEVQEEVMQAISLELHDNIAQVLSGTKMQLLSLIEKEGASNPYPDLKIASGRLGKSINDIHSLSHLLNGRQMKKIGLIEAIHKELKFVNSVYCMSCTFTYDPLPDMGSDKNLLLFRIVQEAVYNSLRHGCASELAIRIKYDEKGLLMKIKDNGRGFNPSGLGRNSGIGLSNIRERIKLLGGTMRLESSPDLGTTLFLTC